MNINAIKKGMIHVPLQVKVGMRYACLHYCAYLANKRYGMVEFTEINIKFRRTVRFDDLIWVWCDKLDKEHIVTHFREVYRDSPAAILTNDVVQQGR